MPIMLTEAQRTELAAAAAAEKRARRWTRYQAVLLRGEGLTVTAVATARRCSQARVSAWSAAWRQDGAAGLREGDHGGGQGKLGAAEEALLTELLASDPQAHGHRATGWTVPLLRGELARVGVGVGQRPPRRALHRLGDRWKRPRYLLGRPDPAYAEKRGR